LLGFAPFFFYRSLLGGVDVAWRAVHPRMPINPRLVEYPIQLPPGLPQVFMANIVSLLPGTLSAELSARLLRVHVLSSRGDVVPELEALERRIAGVFGVSLPARGGM
ncbi:MAG: Na+/H+ antiporter subunit E, partial [Chromatiales bacterium]|nr:Na+/H+ antiporter subunit E [Chromatiales bacterium]